MAASHPIDQLSALSHTFDRNTAAEKLDLLATVTRTGRYSAARIRRLHDTLYFMRAYPDNPEVLRAITTAIKSLRRIVDDYTGGDPLHDAFVDSGLPGSSNSYAYSYAVLQRLARIHRGVLEIDWDNNDDHSLLAESLFLTVAPVETRGLEDEYSTLREWLQHCKSHPDQRDLDVVLQLFTRSTMDAQQQMHIFESCDVPIRYDLDVAGTGRAEVALLPEAVHYQATPLPREHFPLKAKITEPLGAARLLPRRAGRAMLDLSLRALCCRNLEIQPLIYGNPGDVTVVDCERGVQVMLSGTQPDFRPVIESDFFFLILKNGVPVAYGPASVFAGCCEMGINLFPEFRGGEIRFMYAQFMRALHHLCHVRYFFLTSYGMGEDNPEALKSGAFWFYRKLGFKPTNPDVEALARREEKIMRRRSRYRSSLETLRELSHTEVYLDLSGGACRPTNFEAVGQAVSRHIAAGYGGDRGRAEREAVRRAVQRLQIEDFAQWNTDERRAIRQWAPLVDALPEITDWPLPHREALAALIKAKGATSEIGYAAHAARLSPLADALANIGKSPEAA